MPVLIPHDEFLKTYFDQAWKIAGITIASTIKKNGPINPAIDIESVQAEGAIAGLERTFENFDANHESGAQLTTLLSKIVHNAVLTELGKATTKAKNDGLIAPGHKKKKKMTKEEEEEELKRACLVFAGIKQRANQMGPVEAHGYQEADGWLERKEKVLDNLTKYMKRLPVNDQVILSNWANDEKTYVERSMEELGLENTPAMANWIYGRKNKALKSLAQMMGGKKPDYRDIYLPSAGRNTNSTVYSDRNELRRHQYAAKAYVTRNINYKETAQYLSEKAFLYKD